VIGKVLAKLFGGNASQEQQAEPSLLPLQGHPLEKRVTLLCEAYVLKPALLCEIRSACRQVEAMHPNHRALATLDHVTQAFYTNGHAVGMYELDNLEGHNLDALPPTAFEDGEHLGYFTTKDEFPFRVANFNAQLIEHPVSDKTLGWVDANTNQSVDQVNAQPDSLVHQPCIVMAVPVAQACETVMAFPNGYFSPDLNPFEVYRLCAALEAKGYALFAIGASYLAFERAEDAQDVSEILNALYVDPDLSGLSRALNGQPYLILRYTA